MMRVEIGARAAPAKTHAMPTTMNAAMGVSTLGTAALTSRPTDMRRTGKPAKEVAHSIQQRRQHRSEQPRQQAQEGKSEEDARLFDIQVGRDREKLRPTREQTVKGIRRNRRDDRVDERFGLEDHARIEDLDREDGHAQGSPEHGSQSCCHRCQQQRATLLTA
jgi:hypothetical protein